MKVQIYSVYDSKTKVFGQPMFMLNEEVAKRSWAAAANDPNSNICMHPGDFTLFKVGIWDDEKGEFIVQTHENFGTAVQAIDPRIAEVFARQKTQPAEAQMPDFNVVSEIKKAKKQTSQKGKRQ